MSVVTIEVPLEELRRLLDLAEQAVDELAAEVDAKYPNRNDQPVQRRRYLRDMALPNNLASAIGHVKTANANLI